MPLLVAALLVIPVIAVEQSDAGEPWRAIAGVVNWSIWIAFAVELVVMLAVVPDRWTWLRRHPLEAAIVVLTPPFLPATLQAARVMRLGRLLRLLALAKYARLVLSLDGLRYVTILVVKSSRSRRTCSPSYARSPTGSARSNGDSGRGPARRGQPVL